MAGTFGAIFKDSRSTLETGRITAVEDNNKLAYFFLGLGIGVGIGILFAPKSGEETRQLIKSKADEGREYVKRRTEEVRQSASELVEKGKEAISRQREHLAAAVEAGKQAYREAVGRPAEAKAEGEAQS
jgi:gas vesicle protein